MAKKIRIDSEEENRIEKPKIQKKKDEKNEYLIGFFLIESLLLVIGLIVTIVLYNQKIDSLNEEHEEEIESIDTTCAYKTDDDCNSNCKLSYSTEIEKANFLDENIVFEVKELGNYYYTYDCMMKKAPSEFTYWAYNIEAAKSEGLKEGKC